MSMKYQDDGLQLYPPVDFFPNILLIPCFIC